MDGPSAALLRAATQAARQDGVLTRAQVDDAGVPDALLRMLLRAGSWKRLFRGTFLVETERNDLERRRSWARAAVLAVPGSAVSHHTAAVLLGVHGVPRQGRVHLTRAWSTHDRAGLRVHESPLPAEDVVDVGGIPVTSPVRTLSDLVPVLPEREALVVLDSALFREVATRADLDAARDRAAGRRGCRRSWRSWDLADAGAESPLESRTRWECLSSGLRPMRLQLTISDDDGVVVARADLAFDNNTPPLTSDEEIIAMGTRAGRATGLLLPTLCEADGEGPHSEPAVLAHDRHRQNDLVGLRYPIVRIMWEDTMHPGRVVASVRKGLTT